MSASAFLTIISVKVISELTLNSTLVENLAVEGQSSVGSLEIGELDVANTILVLADRLKGELAMKIVFLRQPPHP